MRSTLFAVTVLTSTPVFSLIAVVGGLLGARKGLYDWIHKSWSRLVLKAAGVEVWASGLENVTAGGAQIFVSNHQSMFDIWALFATLPVSLRFVAKKELSRIPVFARAMRSAGHVFIDRKDRTQAAIAMRESGDRMTREGLSLGLFPEGTRARDGELKPFKKGTFVLAIETQTTLVPVLVEGGSEIAAGGLRVRPRPLILRCAKPIPLAGLDVGDRDRLLDQTRTQIVRMLEEARGVVPDPI